MEQVGRRATELQLGLPLYRVTFNRAQCLYATLEYAAAVEVLSPLVSNDSRYTAKAMALMHTAAALCGTGEYTKAREAMRSVGEVATKTKGRLDAQLWQRAQCWLAREDGDLPLCAIELHYSVQYLKGQPADPDLLSRFTVHAAPILAAFMQLATSRAAHCYLFSRRRLLWHAFTPRLQSSESDRMPRAMHQDRKGGERVQYQVRG